MRVDAGQKINQALMADTTIASSSTESLESQNTDKAEGKKGSSKLCGTSCKKGLQIAGRILLAILTLGISEGVRKGIQAYYARQARSEGARMGKLWKTGKPSFPESSSVHNLSETGDNNEGSWTSSSQRNSYGVSSFGKELASHSPRSSNSHIVLTQSPHKPSNDVIDEVSLETNNGGTTGE